MIGNSGNIGVGVVRPSSNVGNGGSSSNLTEEEFVALPDQVEFPISGNPASIKMVFEEQAYTKAYTYEEGVLTMDNPVYEGVTITVFY